MRNIMNEDDKLWIRLTDSAVEGRYLWVDGSPLCKRLDCCEKLRLCHIYETTILTTRKISPHLMGSSSFCPALQLFVFIFLLTACKCDATRINSYARDQYNLPQGQTFQQ